MPTFCTEALKYGTSSNRAIAQKKNSTLLILSYLKKNIWNQQPQKNTNCVRIKAQKSANTGD